MHMRFVRTILIALLVTSIAVAANDHSYNLQEKTSTKLYTSEFRYLIINNNLLHNSRIVSVLLSEQAFSEVNMKKLFMLLSKRWTDPDELRVIVYTNLEQIPTPEEEEHNKSLLPGEGKTPPESSVAKYPLAIYLRWNANESFSYSNGAQGYEKTIVIRGEDVLHRKKKLP